MSESNSRKRNLPSWMSSREEESDENEKSKQLTNRGKSKKDQNGEDKTATGSGTSDFSILMEGVTFVLSGFVNPERGVLRSQMLEMGAEYQPDWNSNCTLLVCAFSNTPKFRQVKADGGTIISKDWISDCYVQRKLVDIEPFLLHAGKPWRRQCISHEARKEPSSSTKYSKQEETGLHSKKATGSSKMKGSFSPAKAKKWAVEDLKRTISWLENQEEKPGPSEIKKIAAEGILTCLQDAIDALKQGQGVHHVTEQWACLPRVVEQLAQFDGSTSPSKEDLCREVMACKQIYELEFLNMEHDDTPNDIKAQNRGVKKGGKNDKAAGNDPYDSDATVEMTEDEIDQAYSSIASSF
ncbi:DNA-repair protein XRCC1 [Salvia miltiorrhiza]|uniref:DNA-repair protein XRCC1 n=1 Tax=Salvia miltiorrhiza TaxID=226208 RepID=UPI0025AD8126|nr:DNA-repair protein XRCC1 [Salvia miltiorrhiza]XP_057772974.1 DNA-repair protein XRCC1 [Salvia miltiorrhiza]XP_057772975.1 DNA-repair protein XRCC1 [Salvia miltiorrhiza]XP_057772976.1 DNA-repair protein XRCC1 [Salvia miltiorrhiza]